MAGAAQAAGQKDKEALAAPSSAPAPPVIPLSTLGLRVINSRLESNREEERRPYTLKHRV